MLPSLRDAAWLPREMAQGTCASQQGRARDAVKQSSGTLSHPGCDSVLLKSPVGSVSCIPVQNQVSCPESRGAPVCPSSESTAWGCSCKHSQGEGVGLAEVERLRGNCSSFAHCPGSCAGEQAVKTWVCSREANCWPNLMPLGVQLTAPVNRLERSTSSPLPALPAPSAPPAHSLWRWKTVTLLGGTTSWAFRPYDRVLNKCILSMWYSKLTAFQARWALLKRFNKLHTSSL